MIATQPELQAAASVQSAPHITATPTPAAPCAASRTPAPQPTYLGLLLAWLKPMATLVGIAIVLLALATHLWHLNLGQLMGWLDQVFGPLFLTVYTALVALAGVALLQLSRSAQPWVWFEAGSQAASGIATLALTFTLLGISLGIESLSAQPLTPESVGTVVQSLTQHFSTAFLTSILGLPTANGLRAVLAVRWRMLNPAVNQQQEIVS